MKNKTHAASIYEDAMLIIKHAIKSVQPEPIVYNALRKYTPPGGKVVLIAIGKAAWQMAKAASDRLGDAVTRGVVITKYGHSKGDLPNLQVMEAGHPVPDENSFAAADAAIMAVRDLTERDSVVFLISGGGSALFEKPLIPPAELADIYKRLLACGADIVEINILRKRLSGVKGGKFAQLCAPAQVFSIVLSDIIGDPPDMIASGPAAPDSSTCDQAFAVLQKYDFDVSEQAKAFLAVETPKILSNVTTEIAGSVRQLCAAAAEKCAALGYEPHVLTAGLCCEAREAGSFLASVAQFHQNANKSLAFLAGGETVVTLKGGGDCQGDCQGDRLGGRNQELALAAAAGISNLTNTAVFSFGSDGTDGPTDAAGGFVDHDTLTRLRQFNIDPHECLRENNSYKALQSVNGLIMTGPTGTNVNDLSVVLIRR